jgi:hypothetical protein
MLEVFAKYAKVQNGIYAMQNACRHDICRGHELSGSYKFGGVNKRRMIQLCLSSRGYITLPRVNLYVSSYYYFSPNS